ncbi:Protein of unknown function [Halopelagius inordinatus]|uniref:DUF4013 domain-containing protein n=1 Tax=Halopelagius inordinatus TaxID=553467 RepID=A0A1I2R4Z6_9EURY|nr:DUF4013 domain-containing protein [Halopelagius inordinatus]SFG33667.1 Protein of unknown function [Halopelagius inordinatus]
MLGDSLSYPLNSDDRIATILIGGLLSVLGVLVIPAFVIQGYLVRVLRGAAKGEPAAPSFTDWGDLIVDGIKLFVVNLAYGLLIAIPMAVFSFALFVPVSVSSNGGSPQPSAAVGIVAVVGGLLLLVFALLVAYVLPAAMTNFAVEDSLGAAFDFSTIWSGATTSEYFVGWVLAIVVGVVGGLVGSALSVVLVGIFVLFYVQVVSYYLFGRGFTEGLSEKRRAAAETNV